VSGLRSWIDWMRERRSILRWQQGLDLDQKGFQRREKVQRKASGQPKERGSSGNDGAPHCCLRLSYLPLQYPPSSPRSQEEPWTRNAAVVVVAAEEGKGGSTLQGRVREQARRGEGREERWGQCGSGWCKSGKGEE
jgi:hypothetical protein